MKYSKASKNHKTRIVSIFVLTGIFVFVFAGHFFSRNILSGDSVYSIHTAMSIIKEKNLDLDEYEEIIKAKKNQFYCVKQIKGHYYFSYPVGASFLSIPLVYLIDKILPILVDSSPVLENYIRNRVTLPFGTILKVTNLRNGRSIKVRINDRGPYKGKRILDLSLGAAKKLQMIQDGVIEVELKIILLGGG